MQRLLLAVFLVLAGCATPQVNIAPSVLPQNMTESEVRELPPGTTLRDIKKRLHYYTAPGVMIPMISFVLGGSKERECVMTFSGPEECLDAAWISSARTGHPEEDIVIWPKARAGTRLLEPSMQKKRANQPLEPTPISVTPAADAPVAPDTGAAHL